MAHADYHCCACCDAKMCYSNYAETKERLCSRCAASLTMEAGRPIGSLDALKDWLAESPALAIGALAKAGYDPCPYSNPFDDLVAAIKKAVAVETGGDDGTAE